MRSVVRSSESKRDIKRAKKRGKDLERLRQILELLIAGDALPPSYKDHPLRGDWTGYRDLHIEPDWLLINRIDGNDVHLARTGRHVDLFDE